MYWNTEIQFQKMAGFVFFNHAFACFLSTLTLFPVKRLQVFRCVKVDEACN